MGRNSFMGATCGVSTIHRFWNRNGTGAAAGTSALHRQKLRLAKVHNWQEQDGILREMWMRNQSPTAIAEALGRSVPAIMTRAARLGLPRRFAPGRKPGRRSFDTIANDQLVTARAERRVAKSRAPYLRS